MEEDDPLNQHASSAEVELILEESNGQPVPEPQPESGPTETSRRRVTFAEIESRVMEDESSALVECESSVEGDEVQCYIFSLFGRWRGLLTSRPFLFCSFVTRFWLWLLIRLRMRVRVLKDHRLFRYDLVQLYYAT